MLKKINAEIYTKYNSCLNHILIIQKKQKSLLTQEKGEKNHSIQHFSYYKNIAHSDNVAQITGF